MNRYFTEKDHRVIEKMYTSSVACSERASVIPNASETGTEFVVLFEHRTAVAIFHFEPVN